MSWQDDGILFLRTLIWDNDTESVYSDSRLEEVLIVAAKMVNFEISFSTTYTVDTNTISISPDPSDDKDFMYFMTLKAACLVDRGNMRVAAMTAGVNAKCGPATISTSGRMSGFELLMKEGYCKTYETAKMEYILGNGNYIRAILSPFINGDFDPSDYNIFSADDHRLR